jgi:hypothetical protein
MKEGRMAVELKLRKVEMTHDAPKGGTQKGDRADIHVTITGLGPMEVRIEVFDPSSLDDAVEKARKVIHQFALDLAKVADQPPLR